MMRAGIFFLAAVCSAQVRYEDIVQGPNENWLTYAGNYSGQRHSPLKEITTANARNMAAQWVYHVPDAKKLEGTPIVYDGVMYVTNSNAVHALDARTGRKIWAYIDDQAQGARVNRGAAILGNSVYIVTTDCHLVALNRKTGALLYHKKYADIKDGYFATMAPFAAKDKIIVGMGGGDSGARGFLAALSATTGEELWRTYTVPQRGEPGSETWSKDFPLKWGGAATWLSGTYDPQLGTLYWTTGNPWPDFYGGDREGANLYSDSVIALDVDTGKLKWYFQFTPHDTHDWDAQSWPVLVDLEYQGKQRKVVLHPNRNGFLYMLDRVTGEFLRGSPMVDKLDWATGLDAKGAPIVVPGKDPTPGGNKACPSVRGAANWMSPSYNPATGLFYVPTLEQCDTYFSSQKEPVPMKGFAGTGGEVIASEPGQLVLRAFDPRTGKRVWEHPMTGPAVAWAGTVSTAGGVLFFGDDNGQLVAADAKNGKHLWHFGTSQSITASPITYMVEGKQYVAICSATHVYSFGLFEPAVE